MKKITIQSKIKNFEVIFADDFKFINELVSLKNSVVVVGKNVYSLYKKNIFDKFPKDRLIVIPLEEKDKTIDTAIKIYLNLLNRTAKKNLTIISFGGGVNQDVIGFVASTLYRGIDWIYVPTTLLAMADSSIGLKTSLNFQSYKNVLGTFFPPIKIIINVDFLKTLSKPNYYSGIGEVVKLYLMQKNPLGKIKESEGKLKILRGKKTGDRKLILKIIKESMKIKLSYMAGDEFDKGRRNLLNYGHEFGHALEPVSSYAIPHGVAVLIGIIFANIIACKRKLLDKKTTDNINKRLIIPNLPLDVLKLKKTYFDKDAILKNMRKDKKVINEGLVLVLPNRDFSLVKINNLTIDEYQYGLIELENLLRIN